MVFVAVGDATQLHGQTEELVVSLALDGCASLAAEPFVDDGLVRDILEGGREDILHHRFHRFTQIIFFFIQCVS